MYRDPDHLCAEEHETFKILIRNKLDLLPPRSLPLKHGWSYTAPLLLN